MDHLKDLRSMFWASVGVAATTIVAGLSSKPVHAVECKITGCTYWAYGVQSPGICGHGANGQFCQCVQNGTGNGEQQDGCLITS